MNENDCNDNEKDMIKYFMKTQMGCGGDEGDGNGGGGGSGPPPCIAEQLEDGHQLLMRDPTPDDCPDLLAVDLSKCQGLEEMESILVMIGVMCSETCKLKCDDMRDRMSKQSKEEPEGVGPGEMGDGEMGPGDGGRRFLAATYRAVRRRLEGPLEGSEQMSVAEAVQAMNGQIDCMTCVRDANQLPTFGEFKDNCDTCTSTFAERDCDACMNG